MDDFVSGAGSRQPAGGDLAFIPLGGTGEIGMNLNLYRCDGKLLAVDCGIGFGGPEMPEAEIVVPDASWAAERRDSLVGLVITHAHEDHVGAVAYLWPQLRCPIYAGPFASAVLRRKLGEAGLAREAPVTTVPLGGKLSLPPFDLEFLRVSHSVPEAQALAIRTRHGLVLHTGDWKLDPEPLTGPPTDEAAFARLGEEGVLAMVCDSTNALVEGHSGSEAEVRRNLAALVRPMKGRVAVTCFATNIARVESIARAAHAAGRQASLFGAYLGGVIAPGVNLSLEALHQAAARLPRIGIGRPQAVIGRDTVAAMQSGVYWGYVGMIEGIIARIKGEQGPLKVVATGGLAPLFSEGTTAIEVIDQDITLEGLRLLAERNPAPILGRTGLREPP